MPMVISFLSDNILIISVLKGICIISWNVKESKAKKLNSSLVTWGYVNRNTRKGAYHLCEQRSLRSACAFVQTDQSLPARMNILNVLRNLNEQKFEFGEICGVYSRRRLRQAVVCIHVQGK